MLNRKCRICNKIFKVPKSYRRKRGFYCSQKCYGISKKGKPSWNKGLKTGLVPKTAFKKRDKRLIGKNNYQWKGIKKCSQGYIWLYRPKHPFAKKNYVLRSRLKMERHLKRYLKPEEVVHHRGKRDDDRLIMLVLFLNQTEHKRFHCIMNNPNKK